MSDPMVVVVGLTLVTFACKGAGSVLPRIPDAVARRTAGLAPALLAGLIVSQVVGGNGLPHVDARLAGVGVALVLAWRRAPLAVTVIAGAATAAALRAF